MKKYKFLKPFSSILLTGFLIFGSISPLLAHAATKQFKVGDKFLVSDLKLGDKSHILAHEKVDVTGDKVADEIILVGDKLFSEKDLFTDNMHIVVQDGKTLKYKMADHKSFSGYFEEKDLLIKDLNHDGIKDVMVGAATGGSGGLSNHLIVTFKEDTPKILFDEKNDQGIEFDKKFEDDFKVTLKVKNSDQSFTLDVSNRKEEYIKQGLYNKNGKVLKSDVSPMVYPFSSLEVDQDENGKTILKGMQRVVGLYNADTLTFFESRWAFNNEKWQLISLKEVPKENIEKTDAPTPSTDVKDHSDEFKIGEEFKGVGLNLEKKNYILDYNFSDVTGDNIKDDVLLIGEKFDFDENTTPSFSDQINIVVRNGNTRAYSKTDCENLGGMYDHTSSFSNMFIGDVTGDKIKDVLVSVPSGGNGGMIGHVIATFKDNQPKIIFDEKNDVGIHLQTQYLDDFKVQVTAKETQQTFTCDVSYAKDMYIKMGIYNKSGKLLKPDYTAMTNGLSSLKAVDQDGVYELESSQRICGLAQADTIDYLNGIWKFEDGVFKLKKVTQQNIDHKSL